MWWLSNFIPESFTERALSPALKERMACRLLPEEGTRSDFKNALFAAFELGIEVAKAQMDLMSAEFSGFAKESMFRISQFQCAPADAFFPLDLLYDRPESSASSFRKIYRANGTTAVLWDRSKGKQFNDDS